MGRLKIFLIAILSFVIATSISAAPALSLSVSSIQNDFNGTLTHTITGLASGETVTVERVADINGNGAIDAGEPPIRTFIVADGVRPIIGGVVNGNVPGDDDGAANSAIRVDLPFPGVDVILNRQPGKYIIRVSGASGQATALFEITAPNLPQRVTGVLKNSSNGSDIPFGIIVVLVGDGIPVGSVRTDSTGAFTFIAPPGGYGLIPFSDGFAADFQFVNLPANQIVTQNLSLVPAPVRVNGKLTDASSSNGLPGVFILAQVGEDDGAISGALTDLNGNFTLAVTPGSWELRPFSESASQLGYVIDEAGPTITASSSPITQNLTARKATALVYGRVTDPSSSPVQGMSIRGRQQLPFDLETHGRTLANGDYFIGLINGDWEISTDGAATALGFREHNQALTIAGGAATRSDIQLASVTAYLRGRVVDSQGNGIPGVFFHGHFENSGNESSGVDTSNDGSFELPVWGGNWYFHLGENDPYINHKVFLTIVDGVDQNITFVVPTPTGEILGSVKNASNQGISGIFVQAEAIINGVEYRRGAETDSNGQFTLPVINGNWMVFLSCDQLEERNYECASNQNAAINNNNATVNFTVQTFVTTASLNGRLIDASGNGLGGFQVGAYISGGATRTTTTQADGSFSVPVLAGQWSLQAFNLSSALLTPTLQFNVTDGVNVNNIQLKLIAADATLSGTVKNSSGAPLSGIEVYANANINGLNYSLPFATTDAFGSFDFSVARGSWNLNLNCSQLDSLNYNCPGGVSIDTTSGSATHNLSLTAKGAANPPNIKSTMIDDSGAALMFEFTLEGDPGTYDIYGSTIVPFSFPVFIVSATIPPGGSTTVVRFDPGLGLPPAIPSMQNFQSVSRFFRAQRAQ